jgi:hypothetical protein
MLAARPVKREDSLWWGEVATGYPFRLRELNGAVIYSTPLTSRSFVNIHGRATPDTSKSARAIC